MLAFLDRMHAEAMSEFRALTPDALARKCATPEGSQMTTWKWLRLMPEHEIHHRGQIWISCAKCDRGVQANRCWPGTVR